MYKIIGADGKEYGPGTADELRVWIAEGRLSGQSYVCGESSSEWKPLSAFPEFTEALRSQVGYTPLITTTVPAATVAAWSEICISALGFYAAGANLLNKTYGRTILPLGKAIWQ